MTGELMEFCITSDLQEVRKQVITTNYHAVKKWAESVVARYGNIIVTPDTISQAKADRASLRKAQSGVSDVRKEMRAAALSTCAAEESNCKDLEAVFERGVQALDVQIKAMEETAKQEKKDRLAAYFAQVVGDMAEWLTFDDCFNPKWLNATYAESTAQMDVCAAIDRCRADLNAIRALHSEFETTLLDEYTRTWNISAVLVKNETLGRMKAAEEERKRREAEAAAKYAAALKETKRVADETMRQAEQKASETGRSVVETLGELSKPVNDLVDKDVHEMPAAQEPEYKVDFRVFGTARQLDGLKAYMQKNGIRFMPVPQE
mgnify:CR=1 FL=1